MIWIASALPGAITRAAAINVSLRLGQCDPNGAKLTGYIGIVLHGVVAALILTLVIPTNLPWYHRNLFIMLDDEDYQMFGEARVPIATSFVLMNLANAIETILISMGRTVDVFLMKFASSWGVKVYFVTNFIAHWRQDLVGLHTGIAIGDGVLVILYGYAILTRYVL